MVFKFKIPYLSSKQFWLQKSIYGCFIEPKTNTPITEANNETYMLFLNLQNK